MTPTERARLPHTRLAHLGRVEAKKRAEAAIVDTRPPRVEYRRVPALAPIPQPMPSLETGNLWNLCELNKRPDHRVIEVPIPEPTPLLRARFPYLRMEQFQVMEYRLDVRTLGGGTRVRWWSFAPVTEALKPQVRQGLRRAEALSARIRQYFEYDAVWIVPGSCGTMREVNDVREWLVLVLEDVEQAMGRP